MRYDNDDPAVRELNSKVLMEKVLEERAAQIQYKQRKQNVQKMREAEEARRMQEESPFMNEQYIKGVNWAKERKKAMEIVDAQRTVVEEQETRRKAERDEEVLAEKHRLLKDMKERDEDLKALKEKKEKSRREFIQGLEHTLAEKRKEYLDLKQKEKDIDEDSNSYRRYKTLLEVKRREVERKKLEARKQVSEMVYKIQESMTLETESKIQGFLDKLESYPAMDLQEKHSHDSEKHQVALASQEAYRIEKVRIFAIYLF